MDTVFVILQSSQRSQILHKKISTHLLTLLIMGGYITSRTKEREQKEQKMPKTESEFSESFSLNQIK